MICNSPQGARADLARSNVVRQSMADNVYLLMRVVIDATMARNRPSAAVATTLRHSTAPGRARVPLVLVMRWSCNRRRPGG